jgi:hypothetical protein
MTNANVSKNVNNIYIDKHGNCNAKTDVLTNKILLVSRRIVKCRRIKNFGKKAQNSRAKIDNGTLSKWQFISSVKFEHHALGIYKNNPKKCLLLKRRCWPDLNTLNRPDTTEAGRGNDCNTHLKIGFVQSKLSIKKTLKSACYLKDSATLTRFKHT